MFGCSLISSNLPKNRPGDVRRLPSILGSTLQGFENSVSAEKKDKLLVAFMCRISGQGLGFPGQGARCIPALQHCDFACTYRLMRSLRTLNLPAKSTLQQQGSSLNTWEHYPLKSPCIHRSQCYHDFMPRISA